MKVYTDENPQLPSQAKLPCIVLTEEESDTFVGDDPERRNLLYEEARELAEGLQPAPEEVLVYSPSGEVVTGITVGHRFISSEVV